MMSKLDSLNDLSVEDVVDRLRRSEGILEAMKMGPALAHAVAEDPDGAAGLEPLLAARSLDPLPALLAIQAMATASDWSGGRLTDLLSDSESTIRQQAALALCGHHPNVDAVEDLVRMTNEDGFSKMVAELALEEWIRKMPEISSRLHPSDAKRLQGRSFRRQPRGYSRRGAGLRVGQLLMQGRVDGELAAAASGEGGGLITLQVGLTRELPRQEGIAETHLISRALTSRSHGSFPRTEELGDGSHISHIDFGPPGYLTRSEMWAYRADLERELERFLVENGPFDILHLRFADVGTFAGARVAKRLGIPVVFTLAPDPHSVIAAREARGDLTRSTFAAVEEQEHFLFRASLVREMIEHAEQLVLLPREQHLRQFDELLGVDVSSKDRFPVIAEGVDLDSIANARLEVSGLRAHDRYPQVVEDLVASLSAMSPDRRELPLLLTAGRLSHVKGMERAVEAWAGDGIYERFNLAIVGGDLDHPSVEEQQVLARIESAAAGREGLLLLGGRSHRDVARLLAVVRHGIPGHVAGEGIYVSASEKEEFGLAIVEALGTGLPVVAPRNGGPATYVDHGFTGYMVDTHDISDLRRGIEWATRARRSEVRADRAHQSVRDSYSLTRMAEELAGLYRLTRLSVKAS